MPEYRPSHRKYPIGGEIYNKVTNELKMDMKKDIRDTTNMSRENLDATMTTMQMDKLSSPFDIGHDIERAVREEKNLIVRDRYGNAVTTLDTVDSPSSNIYSVGLYRVRPR